MKKRKSDKESDSIVRPIVPKRSGHLRAAIESVFRLTHGREMTLDERRVFGLDGDNGARVDRFSSRNHDNPDGT